MYVAADRELAAFRHTDVHQTRLAIKILLDRYEDLQKGSFPSQRLLHAGIELASRGSVYLICIFLVQALLCTEVLCQIFNELCRDARWWQMRPIVVCIYHCMCARSSIHHPTHCKPLVQIYDAHQNTREYHCNKSTRQLFCHLPSYHTA